VTTRPTASRIAIPVGDPNGIGPEISLKTVAAYAGCDDVALTLFGPAQVLERTADMLGLGDVLARTRVEPTVPATQSGFSPGQVNAQAGAAAIDAATRAIEAAQCGGYDAVVAAPHHETAIALAGIAFSGYPSLVARVCGQPADSVFLLLIGGGLRIVHVTLHESVAHALGRLSAALVVDAARAGARALDRLGIAAPRIALMGVNPHAGEGGLFGGEDGAITEPAALELRAQGFDVTGPAGADMLLASRSHDLYVAIFHDQGHIPIKLLSPQRASAVSIGADVLLSSVGHGSAMDIAGKGVASPRAMIETVAMLANIAPPVHTESEMP
jgi:4-hydroxythreonine-4-phosphate dehydrogenase/1,2-dihydroxy-3,5-cyclohexadiene-1,4-dicarboxylate dehydrogenase